eukprot:1196177-Prorocentrum_minimum.AAC.7
MLVEKFIRPLRPFTQGEIRPLISCASIINVYQIYITVSILYILNWERAVPSPPLLGRAGSRGLADACWADSYTVWSPAQPATPQLHSSSSTPRLHTLAWEGGRKKPGLPSQCSIIQPKPLPSPDVEVCNVSATKNHYQSLLGCQ